MWLQSRNEKNITDVAVGLVHGGLLNEIWMTTCIKWLLVHEKVVYGLLYCWILGFCYSTFWRFITNTIYTLKLWFLHFVLNLGGKKQKFKIISAKSVSRHNHCGYRILGFNKQWRQETPSFMPSSKLLPPTNLRKCFFSTGRPHMIFCIQVPIWQFSSHRLYEDHP